MAEAIIKMKGGVIRQQKNTILKNIDVEIQSGEFVYLIGKVGSGKSSFLKTLYAELPLEFGSAEVAGFQLRKIRKRHIPQLRRKCGIVFQDFKLLIDRNVYANLEFVLRATGWRNKEAIRERIATVLEKVGMTDKQDQMPHQLSGGEQQRIVLARALLNAPPIILADEPTGNIDPETSYKLVELLKELATGGKTVIIATHQYDLLEKFPGRVICCEDGQLFEQMTAAEYSYKEEERVLPDVEEILPEAEEEAPETADTAAAETPEATDTTVEETPEAAGMTEEKESEAAETEAEKAPESIGTTAEEVPEETNMPEEEAPEQENGVAEELPEAEETAEEAMEVQAEEVAIVMEEREATEEENLSEQDVKAMIGVLDYPEITTFDYEIAEEEKEMKPSEEEPAAETEPISQVATKNTYPPPMDLELID